MSGDPAGDAARQDFLRLLDSARQRSVRLPFWWRDDDAETVTPELERLLALARRHGLPLGLAVIPKEATDALGQRLAREQNVRILQHGWRHAQHNPSGDKKAELGDHRPLDAMLGELCAGFDRLRNLFGERVLPVLVPPWNRIGPAVSAARREAGLLGLSAFGESASGDPHRVDTHLDIFEWKPRRRTLARAAAYSVLCREVDIRLQGIPDPIGILTHHLVHDSESWMLLAELLQLLASHPAVVWPPLHDLFGLPDPGAREPILKS